MTLSVAASQCELRYGAGWYFNPARWRTADGYVPFRLLWPAWRRLQAARAADRLDVARAVSLAHQPGEQAKRLTDAELREAYPQD